MSDTLYGGRRFRTLNIMDDGVSQGLAIDVDTWRAEWAIELRYIQPGKPDQNAYIERFNRTYRMEVLNAYVFESLDEVREISAEWLQSYNEERLHEALADLPPAMYWANLEASSLLTLSP